MTAKRPRKPESSAAVRPPLVFLGYQARPPAADPGAYGLPMVREVCAVAECLTGKVHEETVWTGLNAASCYETPALARAAMATPGPHRLFAYRLLPVVYGRGGGPGAMDWEEFMGSPRSAFPDEPVGGLTPLGFDPVGLTPARPARDGWAAIMPCWNCSPLTCNGLAAAWPVNPFGLLDRLEDAEAAARAFARDEPEPGPYVIVEVLRVHQADAAR